MLNLFKPKKSVVYNPIKQRYEKVTYGDEIFTKDKFTGKIYPTSLKRKV